MLAVEAGCQHQGPLARDGVWQSPGFGGVFRIQHGAEYVLNWYREPVYAYGLIIAGVIVIPLGWMPARWSGKLVAWAAKRSRNG